MKNYMILTKKQAIEVLMWSLFRPKRFLIYADSILQGKHALAAYLDSKQVDI